MTDRIDWAVDSAKAIKATVTAPDFPDMTAFLSKDDRDAALRPYWDAWDAWILEMMEKFPEDPEQEAVNEIFKGTYDAENIEQVRAMQVGSVPILMLRHAVQSYKAPFIMAKMPAFTIFANRYRDWVMN